MDYEIIDNFLSDQEFKKVKSEFVDSEVEWYYNSAVSSAEEDGCNNYWNWYFTHSVYYFDVPQSSKYNLLDKIFKYKFHKRSPFRSWIRIRANWYPFTPDIKEHQPHSDYIFDHNSAVFSLNTCDGFTRMSNGDIINSVENRLVIFNGKEIHNSSTTSNSKYRMNINFNWL